ncbi:IscS subfamily cysteine desulfurase [Coxiella endosymbiont of Amblyomma americanum]|uniref:IscS subfamily cysteine desulfurase n=1 Tax=Coxiella endosymbiont of Amblyomma americanum TaxID=325775 RepID=UPI00057F5770|nr:IscS subfamily cysteine desulfurase [Coxiella endosymbiont of Amblyomma americanum]AJC50595.1 cysteine desulfurase [Coxiella endosymbiont of Amblyomma americanum]AUJ58926.1 IscS subfamily cysteine desulfurase [Coxiella-like endosymbiont of Amblyomma americanum]
MELPIYLDYMATTPIDPIVKKEMINILIQKGTFGNSASESHAYGWNAQALIRKARKSIAELINADTKEIIWTSGATESDNLAIKGAAYFYQRKGKHIITMSTEHKAVLDTCSYLSSKGFEITYLNPQHNGLINLCEFKEAIRPDTILVSCMHVNNETGVIQDITTIGEITRKHNILFHVDAAQSAGKIPIDLLRMKIDLMSFSAHKLYGPKGIGALYIRRTPFRVHLEPLIHGGGHEGGLRSGTLATHQIVGMGSAFALAKECMVEDEKKIIKLRDCLWSKLSQLGGVYLNAKTAPRIPGCLNIRFDGIEGESLMVRLQQIAISGGSACNSSNPSPSSVLLSMGLSHEEAYNSIRISLGRFTTEKEINNAIIHIIEQVNHLRQISPLWGNIKRKLIDENK